MKGGKANMSEVRGKDTRELKLDIQGFEKELFGLHFKSAAEEVANTARFQQIRRTVAQIKTVLNERARASTGAESGDQS